MRTRRWSQAIDRAVSECARGVGEIRLAVGGVGVFPDMKRARVIWVGLTGDIARLESVRNALEEACFALGFPIRRAAPFART